WLITVRETIAKAYKPIHNYQLHHARYYKLVYGTNNLILCNGYKLKDSILKTKNCYINMKITSIYNLQVDSNRTIYADLKKINTALLGYTPHITACPCTRVTSTIPQILLVFTNPPTNL
ncbi:7659_t:CDS:1, partial [Gigaspora margarita]